MPHDLLVRGFDDKIHSKLADAAESLGVSLNSIVKDAADKWLKQYSQIPKKHDLILYSDNASMTHLLKSLDHLTKYGDWFRCFIGPRDDASVKLLSKLGWFDATLPYKADRKTIERNLGKMVEKILKTAKGRQVFLFDFIIGSYSKYSLEHAIQIEHGYNSVRMSGVVYCPYRLDILMDRKINDLLTLLEEHDQTFVLKGSELYKLHVTRENVHKLLLN